MHYVLFLIIALLSMPFTAKAELPILPGDSSSAVILAYHRIGEDAQPDTSLRLEQFQDHMEEIVNGQYNVMPLSSVLSAIQSEDKLPPRSIVLTFEGTYASALNNAAPLLLNEDIPFTLVIASDLIDSGASQSPSWDDLRKLIKNPLVSVSILPASYQHMGSMNDTQRRAAINKARQRVKTELNLSPEIFAYPFGEYDESLRDIIKDMGFKAALGLQSGAMHPASDVYALPRFSMTESYGTRERFTLISRAMPLPAKNIQPAAPLLKNNEPIIGFSIPNALQGGLKNLSCFLSSQGKVEHEIIADNRIEIRTQPLEERRTRLNCTMPGPATENPDGENLRRWRWLGFLLVYDETNDG